MSSAAAIHGAGFRSEPFRLDRIAVANGALLLLSGGLFMGYLCLCTYASENGYRLRDAERRVANLTGQKERQAMSMLSAQSLSNVDREVQALGLVPIQEIKYVSAGGSVAMR
jgi:hypothetical protein